ncbi:trehalose-phosphatase [Agrobacterium vitis]|uniref:trehalose-phosphatase n=1 Tax=Agrobacterium vitis TaxID=373 RepID=UPI003D2E75A9
MENQQSAIKRSPARTEQKDAAALLFDLLQAEPHRYALFLDIDGTLLDLAESPDGIRVPVGLADDLEVLSSRMGGALALVTGRALAYADRLFAPKHFPIAGLHGTERRTVEGTVIRSEPSPAFLAVKEELPKLEQAWPGVLVEDKGAAIAVHYRQAPAYADVVEKAMADAFKASGPGYELQRGKMVVEIRPDSADKGRALQSYLVEPPFTDRVAIAIGDDVTDEAMFECVNRLGGLSIRVGDLEGSVASQSLASPQLLRDTLARLARQS